MSIAGPTAPGFSSLNQLDARALPGQDGADGAQSGQRSSRAERAILSPLQDRVDAEAAPPPGDPQSIFAALAISNSAPADADAARLLALSVRQGLQEQSASIANLRPNSILQYLRA